MNGKYNYDDSIPPFKVSPDESEGLRSPSQKPSDMIDDDTDLVW